MSLEKSNLRGVAFALFAFAVYSGHDVVIKFLGENISPFQILFFSVLLSFPLVTLMMMRERTQGNLRPVYPAYVATRTIAGTITGGCAFYAFSVLPLAQVYAFIFAAPLLITVLSIPILGEKVGIHRWAAVALGLIGVLIVLRPGAAPLTLGHMAGLAAAAGSAVVSVVTRKIGREERSAVLMLYPMMANVVVMGAVLPFVWVPIEAGQFGLLALMSALGFVGGVCSIAAYRNGDAAIVAPMQYSQIIWGALFGLLIFSEVPDRFTLVGAGVIILAGIYVVVRESLGGSKHTAVLETRTQPRTPSGITISAMLRDRAARVLPGHEALAKPAEAK